MYPHVNILLADESWRALGEGSEADEGLGGFRNTEGSNASWAPNGRTKTSKINETPFPRLPHHKVSQNTL